MAVQTVSPAGSSGGRDQRNTGLQDDDTIGQIEPFIGRIATRDIDGYFGFPLIKKGQPITRAIAERAQSMARLFELIASTEG